MRKITLWTAAALVLLLALALSACEGETVEVTRVVTEKETVTVVEEKTVKGFTFDDGSKAKIRAFTKEAGIRIGTKRWIPKDRGRAHPIRKKACHIHVTVSQG